MDITKAIRSRRSIRAFKPDQVPKKVLQELLETCRWAPSFRNTQTWELSVLGGEAMAQVKARLDEKVKGKVKPNPDIHDAEPPELYLQRATEARDSLDAHQFPPGTENLEAKRGEYWIRGGRFHDAPNGIILYSDKAIDPRSLINAGIMAQTIALAAPAYGLGTCMMTRAVNYPEILRELLGIPESKLIIMGLAIGYPASKAIINTYQPHRVPVETFVHWHGF